MVRPVHHATLATAAKSGITVLGGADDEFYTVLWAERNKRFQHTNAAQGVADMKVWKMLILEYPQLKAAWDLQSATWTISLRGDVLGSASALQDAWDAAYDIMTGSEGEEDEPEDEPVDDGETDEEPRATKSVIKRSYVRKYRAGKGSNGDELATQLRAHLLTATNDDGKPALDVAKMKKFFKLNGCWDARYDNLNPGMVRMNGANRLRNLVRKGHQIVWN